ncbi:DUF6261 family protein [Marinifilum fragile]|uniref:DUF6261 family protein n=1 Tax=Marinifilum fragile TaxID=570161 RepID=UPI002AABC580|nr:DUF6261 family protein [Marinifilum fragile]
MFEKINYRNLTNTEVYNLIKTVIAIVSGVDTDLLKLKLWLDKLSIPFKKLEVSIGLDRGSDKTELIREADDIRDNCFKAIKAYLEACKLRNNEAWQNAAEVLWRIIENHGLLIHNESYSKESSLLDNLIIELDENKDAKEAITILLLTEWHNELKSAQQSFLALWNERRDERINKPTSESIEARKAIKETTAYLFQSIELNYISTNDETYLNLINGINDEIKNANTIAKARITRRKNNEEVMEESEV